jgi:hypothetical protein
VTSRCLGIDSFSTIRGCLCVAYLLLTTTSASNTGECFMHSYGFNFSLLQLVVIWASPFELHSHNITTISIVRPYSILCHDEPYCKGFPYITDRHMITHCLYDYCCMVLYLLIYTTFIFCFLARFSGESSTSLPLFFEFERILDYKLRFFV